MNLRRINLGCGGNKLPKPWENFDADVDITKPLPFQDGSVGFLFAEHVVEHVSPPDAWRFFKECRRILARGGILRIAVPSIVRVIEEADGTYFQWIADKGFGDRNLESAVENIVVNHGHLALWTEELLITCFTALNFYPCKCFRPGVSDCAQLRGVEGHGKVIGEFNNAIETIVVEAVR